jgi:hypothetical protein
VRRHVRERVAATHFTLLIDSSRIYVRGIRSVRVKRRMRASATVLYTVLRASAILVGPWQGHTELLAAGVVMGVQVAPALTRARGDQ